ncbi:hypothetical protein FACS189461_3590 [Spirochaetia bacterium]|nr:hypothetical protein FACS189461_3590 [Spirochaetia bacterium]
MEYQDRKIFIGDEATNFREIKAGNMASGILYRSNHPLAGGDIGNAIGRLAKKVGIKCVLNLDDVYRKTQILYQLGKMNNGIAVTDGNIKSAVERYLLDDVGLSAEEIEKLKNILTNSL